MNFMQGLNVATNAHTENTQFYSRALGHEGGPLSNMSVEDVS